MIGSANSEFNSVGGLGYGGGFGGFGGIGLFGLLGLRGIGGFGEDERRRGGDDCCEDIKNNARNLAVLQAIQNGTDATVAEGRALAAAICDSEKTNLQQFFAAQVSQSNGVQAIKDQAIALAIANNQNLTELKEAGVNQTAAILARINEAETQRLRDELEITRHGLRSKEVEIQIQNTNTNIQQQMQQQQQQITQKDFDIHRRFDALFAQTAKSNQDIIAVGSLLTGVAQAANPVNVKS